MDPETSKSLHNCPACGHTAVVRSRSRGLDGLLAITGRKPYRCRKCDKRFYYKAETDTGRAETRRESRKRQRDARRREFVVYCSAALVVVVMVAFLITGQP